MKKFFHTDDQIIAGLKLPDPCPIHIEIKEKDLILRVGQRDWQWDLEDGHLVGQGTCCVDREARAERVLKGRKTRVRKAMDCDREERLRKGTSPSGDDRISRETARAAVEAVKK